MEPNSKAVGDETEARIILELIAHGYSVSLPFGDNDKYDIIIDDAGRLYRVQCKTAWRTSPDTIRFNTHSQTTKDGDYHESSYSGEIDAFLVRCPETETLYWIDIERAAKRKMSIRSTAAIDHPSINWAEDYEFTGDIPASADR